MLPTPEQRAIIDAVKPNTNIIINAVAGSGKTTTNLMIAKEYPKKKILLLTYNNHLRHETKDRASGLRNIDIHTFHSFAAKLSCGKCYNDTHLNKFLKEVDEYDDKTNEGSDEGSDEESTEDSDEDYDVELDDIHTANKYDIVIIDEAQDLTPILFKLCKHVIYSCAKVNVCVIILGDFRQNIYGYAGADYRYMKFFHEILSRPSAQKIILPLRQSWRLTGEMTEFINKSVFGGKKILESHESRYTGTKPKYIYDDGWNAKKSFTFKEIKRLLDSGKYIADDIFVLAPSVTLKERCKTEDKRDYEKRLKPCVRLANLLSDEGYACQIRTEGDGHVSTDCLKGKIVFSSFHQAKGRERKVVFLLGFDMSYFEYFNRRCPRTGCTNELYVGLTRSKELLYVINDGKKSSFEFVDRNALVGTTEIHGTEFGSVPAEFKMPKKSVSDYLRSIPSNRQDFVVNDSGFLGINVIELGHKKLDSLPCEVKQKRLVESVADINGVASTILCEYIINGKVPIIKNHAVSSMFYDVFDRECYLGSHKRKKYNIHGADNLDNFVEEILRLSLVDICAPAGSLHRFKQIKKYNWADSRTLMTIYARIRTNVICHKFEEYSGMMTFDDHDKTTVHGRFDILSGYRLYEIKTTDELSNEHFIQTALYDLIRQRTGGSLEDAKSRTEVAIKYLKNLRDDLDERDAYRLGDPVTYTNKKTNNIAAGFIYEFIVSDKKQGDIRVINQHGNLVKVSGDEIDADLNFFDAQIKILEDDIAQNKFRTFLYNVRSNEMYEVTLNDHQKLYDYLSDDFSNHTSDDEFIEWSMGL